MVVNDAGDVLLIRRSDNGNWAVPGGAIDLGESMTQAAVRETLEETGIQCRITGLVGIYTDPKHVILYTSNGEARQEFSILLTGTGPSAGSRRRAARAARCGGCRGRSSAGIRWTGRCGCGSGTTWRRRVRRTWAEAPWRGQALLACTRPTASRISGVARLMKRLTRWPRAVAVVDLGQAVAHLDLLAVGAGGHVAEGQRVGQRPRRRGELAVQDVGEAAFFGLDDGAGVVRDQAAQQGFGVVDVAQVAGAVQAVQAGGGEFGEVADVVQPRGGLEQVGVGAEGRVEGAGPGGDALDVGPAAGKRISEEGAGEVLSPGCEWLHEVHASQRGWDVHGRGVASGDV